MHQSAASLVESVINVRLISSASCLVYVSGDTAVRAMFLLWESLRRRLDNFCEGKDLLRILITHTPLCSGVDGRLPVLPHMS